MGVRLIQYRIHGVRDPENRMNIVVEDRATAKFFWKRGHRVFVRTAYADRGERRSHFSEWKPRPPCKDPIDEDLSWKQFVEVMVAQEESHSQ